MKTTHIAALVLNICYLQLLLLLLPAPISADSQSLVDAWTNIKTNYANDLQQSNNIYMKIRQEQQVLNELRIIVERHIRTKNAEQLANAIGTNDSVPLSETNLKELIKNITSNYNAQLVESIFAQAMDEVIQTKPPVQLPDTLQSLYEIGDTESFEMMIRLQLQLFISYSSRHQNDEKEFLQKYSYILYKIINNRLYRSLNLSIKSKLQNVIEKLPTNLQYLYFTPHFCLVNEKYEKYIYAAIEAKVDAVSRYIWLWYDTKTMDDTGYIKAEVSESNGQYQVSIKSTKYQMFYYMMPGSRKIAGWDTSGTPVNYIWNIDFVDIDRVVFSQNDYLMCAVEPHDQERRNVGGRKKGEVSLTTPECQWRLGACIFK